MARITVEDCLTRETNRFALVLLASKRTKQLLHGAKTVLGEERGNKAVVTSLREIADGKVRFMNAEDMRRAEELERQALDRVERAQPQAASHSLEVTPSGNGTSGDGNHSGDKPDGEPSPGSDGDPNPV